MANITSLTSEQSEIIRISMCNPVWMETWEEKIYCGKLVRHTMWIVIKYFSRCVGSKESETDDYSRTLQIMERVIDSIKTSATRERISWKTFWPAFYVFSNALIQVLLLHLHLLVLQFCLRQDIASCFLVFILCNYLRIFTNEIRLMW